MNMQRHFLKHTNSLGVHLLISFPIFFPEKLQTYVKLKEFYSEHLCTYYLDSITNILLNLPFCISILCDIFFKVWYPSHFYTFFLSRFILCNLLLKLRNAKPLVQQTSRIKSTTSSGCVPVQLSCEKQISELHSRIEC